MFDIIGDIHGYGDKLEELLIKLGYTDKHGVFSHPSRKALFLGDYIDRGPQIPKTLQIVRRMVENENAIALIGNHEYNALTFQFESSSGGHLRRHSIKNIHQHFETLNQFNGRQKEYDGYLEWFLSLPLYFETQTFKAVHACWNNENIQLLQNKLQNGCLSEMQIRQAINNDSDFFRAIDQTINGKVITLPKGHSFMDTNGTERYRIRIKWWVNSINATYGTVSVEDVQNLDIPIPTEHTYTAYSANDKNVFFGHYWLNGKPSLLTNNVCCLDYGVAKEGYLVAYRSGGMAKLSANNLVYV